jgi:hypothetical protein
MIWQRLLAPISRAQRVGAAGANQRGCGARNRIALQCFKLMAAFQVAQLVLELRMRAGKARVLPKCGSRCLRVSEGQWGRCGLREERRERAGGEAVLVAWTNADRTHVAVLSQSECTIKCN